VWITVIPLWLADEAVCVSLPILTAIFPGEPVLASFTAAKDDRSGGDNWRYRSCKAPVKMSPPTNQHLTFYSPDALPVAQPTVSKHWRVKDLNFRAVVSATYRPAQVVYFHCCTVFMFLFFFTWASWLGDRKGIRPVNYLVLVCWWWHFDWSFARLIAPVVTATSITLSCNKIQNWDILVPANQGPPGKWPLKRRERNKNDDDDDDWQTNYGRHDAACVQKVKDIYRELQLPNVYCNYEQNSHDSLLTMIDQCSGTLPREMFRAYARKIYKRQKWSLKPPAIPGAATFVAWGALSYSALQWVAAALQQIAAALHSLPVRLCSAQSFAAGGRGIRRWRQIPPNTSLRVYRLFYRADILVTVLWMHLLTKKLVYKTCLQTNRCSAAER